MAARNALLARTTIALSIAIVMCAFHCDAQAVCPSALAGQWVDSTANITITMSCSAGAVTGTVIKDKVTHGFKAACNTLSWTLVNINLTFTSGAYSGKIGLAQAILPLDIAGGNMVVIMNAPVDPANVVSTVRPDATSAKGDFINTRALARRGKEASKVYDFAVCQPFPGNVIVLYSLGQRQYTAPTDNITANRTYVGIPSAQDELPSLTFTSELFISANVTLSFTMIDFKAPTASLTALQPCSITLKDCTVEVSGSAFVRIMGSASLTLDNVEVTSADTDVPQEDPIFYVTTPFNAAPSRVTVVSSYFHDINGVVDGATFNLANTIVNVTLTAFENITASDPDSPRYLYGAAFLLDGCKTTITDSHFISLTADIGPALSVFAPVNATTSNLTVSNTEFSSNQGFMGGVAYILTPPDSATRQFAIFDGCDFHDNSVFMLGSDYGSACAIAVDGSGLVEPEITVTGSSMKNNNALDNDNDGGVFGIKYSGIIRVYDSEISGNEGYFGAVAYLRGQADNM
eukprot:Opistho-2@67106